LKTYSTQKILLAFIKAIVIIVIALGIVWIWLFARVYLSYSSYQKEKVLIKSSLYVGYVADTEEKRAQGLSGRAFLPSNTSMLFEFDKPDTHGIWMKDMLFPIDIIWLDKNKIIVNLVSNAEPESYPHVYYPPKESLYVLEIRAGLIKDKNLKIGDEILFSDEEL
jgi:uncharacterized membrane protein (UPF0127 family)